MKRPMFFYEGDTGGGSGAATTLVTGDTSATGAAVTPQPGAWSWAKEDGTFSDGWLDKMPEGLRGNPSLRAIDSLPNLAKSYIETKSLIGKKLEAPGEGATPEQITAWRKTVGAPETPEGYLGEAKSLRPEAIPENLWDTAGEKQFLAIAHKHSIPPAAVKDILAFYGGNIAAGLNAAHEQEGAVLKEEGAKLRTAWGGEYDANLNIAARVAQTVGLDPKTHPIFTSAEAVQAFAKIGKLMSEDRLVKGETAGGINGSVRERAHDITDPKSTSVLAREYRGEFGPDRQAAAQTQYHQLLSASQS